ncbi:MAG TPA: zinc ribbon domain-containing protein [Longimicrobiales bacterium]|nr:zinc ribbon domain-containing protein [Longimicrobiales bacterium]
MDPVVDRLHRSLVEAIRRRRTDVEAAPVTVAEIYQELVPYRVVRPAVGVELNADYEAALLRLLSGEGDRVRLEPAEARELLHREVYSPNPDTGLYRRFAACEVWVRPVSGGTLAEGSEPRSAFAPPAPSESSGAAEPAESAGPEPAAEPETATTPEGSSAPAAADAAEVAVAPAPLDVVPTVPPAPVAPPELAVRAPARRSSAARTAAAAPPATAPDRTACAFCHEELPVGREVRFCPHCGADQSKVPCEACGETLEPGWRFCIACGEPSPAAMAPA